MIHLWGFDTWAKTWKPFWHVKQIKSNSSILFELSDYGINLNYKSLWVLIKAVPSLVMIALHRAGARLLLPTFSPLVNLHISNVVPCLSTLTCVPVKCGRWQYVLSCNSQYEGTIGSFILTGQLGYIYLCPLQLSLALHQPRTWTTKSTPPNLQLFYLNIHQVQPRLFWFKREGRILYTALPLPLFPFSNLPGHDCFHTSCRPDTGTHEPCFLRGLEHNTQARMVVFTLI